MFTIKHIDEVGNEFAMQAQSYTVRQEQVVAGGEPFMRFQSYDTPYADVNYTGLWTGIKNPLGAQQIFVMNQHGATVAKINFDSLPSDYFGGTDTPA